MKLKFLPAEQKHHPDSPSMGWTITVLDGRGLLFARLYGQSKLVVEAHAAQLKEAL